MEFTVSRKSLKSTDRQVKSTARGQVTGDAARRDAALSIVGDVDN